MANVTGLTAVKVPDRRLSAELSLLSRLRAAPVDVLFSSFGAPLFPPPEGTVSVVNCAYSNLLYPELDFWKGLRTAARMRARLVDFVRRTTVLRARLVTFESLDLVERAIGLFGEAGARFEYLPPARDLALEAEIERTPRTEYTRRRLLFFSGYHVNKNWHILPDIISHLTRQECSLLSITFAEAPGVPEVRSIVDQIRATAPQVEVVCTGPIPYESRASVLRSHDALCLLSSLESFSNNLYEAWAAHLPLVVSDEGWARSEVRDAGLYASLRNPEQAAEQIRSALFDSGTSKTVVNRGQIRLGTYPTHHDRVARVLEIARA